MKMVIVLLLVVIAASQPLNAVSARSLAESAPQGELIHNPECGYPHDEFAELLCDEMAEG